MQLYICLPIQSSVSVLLPYTTYRYLEMQLWPLLFLAFTDASFVGTYCGSTTLSSDKGVFTISAEQNLLLMTFVKNNKTKNLKSAVIEFRLADDGTIIVPSGTMFFLDEVYGPNSQLVHEVRAKLCVALPEVVPDGLASKHVRQFGRRKARAG